MSSGKSSEDVNFCVFVCGGRREGTSRDASNEASGA